MRFEIGHKIWIGDFSPLSPIFETCPDCGGTGRLRVTFHDETQVSIECRNCAVGYDPPTGQILVYRNKAEARQATVTGLEVNGAKTQWHVDSCAGSYRIVDNEDAFESESDALVWAQEHAAAYELEQIAKISKQEKDTRTWAWNASYHRRCIKSAEKDIVYHAAKLAVAAVKAKTKETA